MLLWYRSSSKLWRVLYASRSISIQSRSQCSKEESLVGFNDYKTTWENFKIDVPSCFNFAENVLEKWRHKEKVKIFI